MPRKEHGHRQQRCHKSVCEPLTIALTATDFRRFLLRKQAFEQMGRLRNVFRRIWHCNLGGRDSDATVGVILMFIVGSPLFCLAFCYLVKEDLVERRKLRQRLKEPVHPAFSRHIHQKPEVDFYSNFAWLPLCAPDDSRLQAPKLDQSQSAFLSRLPWDIRRIIYDLVYDSIFTGDDGRSIIHLWQEVEMTLPDPNLVRSGLQVRAVFKPKPKPKVRLRLQSSLRPIGQCPLSLSLACRQMYHETIPILYSNPEFVVMEHMFRSTRPDLYLPTLPPMITPLAFDNLRSLHLDWSLPPDLHSCIVCKEYYEACWSTLRSMKGLQELYISFYALKPDIFSPYNWKSRGTDWIATEILKMPMLKHFQIIFHGDTEWINTRVAPIVASRVTGTRALREA